MYVKDGLFWFEGHIFKDDELPVEPLIERTAKFRFNTGQRQEPSTDKSLAIAARHPLNIAERDKRVEMHRERVSKEIEL